MSHVIGERIGAVLSADKDNVRFLGWGVYDGDLPCPELDGRNNPRMTLDDGTVVWGCQCWWGNEEKMKAWLGDRRVQVVDLTGKLK